MVAFCNFLEKVLDVVLPAPQRALQKAMAFIDSQVIFLCCKLNIADLIGSDTVLVEAIAKELGELSSLKSQEMQEGPGENAVTVHDLNVTHSKR